MIMWDYSIGEKLYIFQIFKYGSKLANTSMSSNNCFDISSVVPTNEKSVEKWFFYTFSVFILFYFVFLLWINLSLSK